MATAGEKTGVVNHGYVGTPITVGPGSSRTLAGVRDLLQQMLYQTPL